MLRSLGAGRGGACRLRTRALEEAGAGDGRGSRRLITRAATHRHISHSRSIGERQPILNSRPPMMSHRPPTLSRESRRESSRLSSRLSSRQITQQSTQQSSGVHGSSGVQRTDFPSTHFSSIEETSWPLILGGALAASVLFSGVFLRRESTLRSILNSIDIGGGARPDADSVSSASILSLVIAFTLTRLPTDELKVKLLSAGALGRWGHLCASYDIEVQQIALGALTAVLDGSAALHSFGEQPELYHELVRSLPSLLHASSDLASRADVQRDVLRLGAILTAHPSCVESADEYWIWERILEFALPLLEIDAAAELDW